MSEKGFSLLELVVAIGITIILAIGGLIGYTKYLDDARQAMVESAAQQTAKGALIYEANHKSDKTAEDAVEAYNSSAKKNTVFVELERQQNGCLIFTGKYKNHDNTAVRKIRCSDSNDVEDNPSLEVSAPILTDACSYDKGLLGLGAKVVIKWKVEDKYSIDNVVLVASKSGIGSQLEQIKEYDFKKSTTKNEDGTYTTNVPTNKLGGLLGLGSELEISLTVKTDEGISAPASIATNAGLLAGIEGTCRNLQ